MNPTTVKDWLMNINYDKKTLRGKHIGASNA